MTFKIMTPLNIHHVLIKVNLKVYIKPQNGRFIDSRF